MPLLQHPAFSSRHSCLFCHSRLLALKLSPAKVLYGEQVSEGKRKRESTATVEVATSARKKFDTGA